jgi:pyruvate,water dikinase
MNAPTLTPWTIPLAQLERKHLVLVGAKAVTLGQMLRGGLSVPPGFVLTTAAFQRYVKSVPGWKAMQLNLTGFELKDHLEAELLSRRIRETLAGASFPSDVEQSINTALDQFPQVDHWAVRSSATAEDLPEASFAGQHDSFLNVPRHEIPTRVRQCWYSLFSSRAILYRAQNRVPHDRAAMAVIIQQMVPAEMAGVLFTADPATKNINRTVIERDPGLG